MGSLYVVSWTLTIDNCYDQVSDRVSNQYVGIALARSEQLVTEQWWQGEGGRSHTYARSASTGNLQIASPKS